MADAKSWSLESSTGGSGKTRISSIAFIHTRLRRLKTRSLQRSSSESPDDIKGPLGLHTLYEPSEPLVDLVFVHGLGGGSRKTWSHSKDNALFWPKEWLPSEPGFKHVRIHTYGYNSEWTKQQHSKLTIHDFGQALLADMHNSPQLRKPGDTPIILVAHSLGGLVVKKAYLLATRDRMYKNVASRLHSIYFLATPHRGADSAQFVTRFLAASISHGSKAYVNELIPGSGTLQAINDEFRHVCHNLRLWSFFESIATTAGPASISIVDRESAVIGLPGEHVQYLEADHRHVCKFESPDDTNYIILHRCLVATIQEIENEYMTQRHDEYRFQMTSLMNFLAVQRRLDSELLTVAEQQHEGSCEWLTASDDFHEWLGDMGGNSSTVLDMSLRPKSRFLWLSGPPGSGKSVACGHVVKYLKACNFDCSYYFFNHRVKATSTISELFRSLAFQMAESNSEIRRKLLEMTENGESIIKDDHNMVWRSIFKSRILDTEFSQPQIWVIDALDECTSNNLSTLTQLLAKIPTELPLKIFFTSRPSGQIENLFHREGALVVEMKMGTEKSLVDIASFVKAKWAYAKLDTTGDHLIAEILRKSNGIFLWASLIMTRLEEVYSIEDMETVLHQVPSEMNEFYERISKTVIESQSADLAKCVLKWVVCAPSPLTSTEIREAARLDINKTLTAPDDKLGHLCGHLVTVDKEGRLQVIHQTVTVFITQHFTNIGIDRPSAHSRLAEVCLLYLLGKEFAPPRSRRVSINRRSSMPFADYACTHFSHHLANCSSSIDAPLSLLDRFVATNSLTWIEQVASTGSLAILHKTIQNIRAYLARREKYRSPLGKEFQQVRLWIDDLAHLVAAFGPNLLDSPSSIHFLIPPLCPPASSMHKLFVKPSQQFRLCGTADEEWDDRITCFMYSSDPLSVACSVRTFAVGLSNGKVIIYNNITFEVVATVMHGEPVRVLSYGNVSSLLVCCGARTVSLWNTRSYSRVWLGKLGTIPLSLAFSSDDSELLIAKRNGNLTVLDTKTGQERDDVPLYRNSGSDSEDDNIIGHVTPPTLVRISATQRIAAIAYRNSPVTIWDLDRNDKIGIFEKEGCEDVYNSPQIIDMVFNPLPDLDLMAVAYKDGDIATFDPWTLEQRSIHNLLAHVLSTSPDGRTLATGDNNGVIHLFSFETLRLMYRIEALEDSVQNIIFSSNSLRFFDIRGSCCNVWEPPMLIRRDGPDDASSEPQSEEIIPAEPAMAITRLFDEEHTISVVELAGDADSAFCGRESGLITVHELSSGEEVRAFHFHARMTGILHLKWNVEHHTLVSVDSSSRCIISQLQQASRGTGWQLAKRVFDHRLGGAIHQILVSDDSSKILFILEEAVEIWATGGRLMSRKMLAGAKSTTWFTHPTDAEQLICVGDGAMTLFNWSTLATNIADIGFSAESSSALSNVTWATRRTYNLIIGFSRQKDQILELLLLDISRADLNTKSLDVATTRRKLAAQMTLVIGLLKSSLYFLDAKGWVCSMNIKSLADSKFYTRHFFIPLIWQTGNEVILRLVSKSSVAFAHYDRLVVFHGFLDFEEKVYFEEHPEKE